MGAPRHRRSAQGAQFYLRVYAAVFPLYGASARARAVGNHPRRLLRQSTARRPCAEQPGLGSVDLATADSLRNLCITYLDRSPTVQSPAAPESFRTPRAFP